MSDVKLRHTRVNIKETDYSSVANCDTLINTIGNFYYKYEHIISKEHSLKVLKMLKTIEENNKHLPEPERNAMYNNIKKMKRYYARIRVRG
ncbi:MAG: hypothetical protein IKP35_01735 [Alphaproteobacteria bacterium]|nr:hypothetical protein [Alphaproteobacteria bacterium]